MSTEPTDMKAQLTEQLKELHLPAMRAGFEAQVAMFAEIPGEHRVGRRDQVPQQCRARRGT